MFYIIRKVPCEENDYYANDYYSPIKNICVDWKTKQKYENKTGYTWIPGLFLRKDDEFESLEEATKLFEKIDECVPKGTVYQIIDAETEAVYKQKE